MGLKKFQIVFDNPWSTYYSGQPVTGRLLLTVDSPKKIRGTHVNFGSTLRVVSLKKDLHYGSQIMRLTGSGHGTCSVILSRF
jgi:hypothetical protein